MIRLRHVLFLAPSAAGVLAMGASTAAASSSLPFRLTVSGPAVFTSQYTVAFNGSGTGILMGAVINAGALQITGPDGSCPGGIANVNTELLTAADGDTLTLTSQDVSCPTGPGTFQGTGFWRIVGGTGRFEGATGTGTGTGSGDFNIGRITNTFTGSITLSTS